jgi:hypothetical protein
MDTLLSILVLYQRFNVFSAALAAAGLRRRPSVQSHRCRAALWEVETGRDDTDH